MDKIPKEIHSIVVSFLDNESKRKMRLASTQWFNIIKYNWFNFYYTTEEQFQAICERLKKYQFPIRVGFVGSQIEYFEKRHYDMLGQITQLTSLININAGDNTPLEDLWALTNLTNLELVDPGMRAAITAHLPNLKSIQITSEEHVQVSKTLSKLESIVYSLDDYAVSTYIEQDLQSLPDPIKLTKLICYGYPCEQKLDMVNDCLIKLSNLKVLSLEGRSWDDGEETILENNWNIPALPNLEKLMMRSLENIQSISSANTKLTQLWITGDIVDCTVFTPLPNLEELDLTGKMNNLSALGSLTKLKNLTLSFGNSFVSMTDMEFLSKLSNLETFDIGSEKVRRNWSESLQYFSENNNLTAITFHRTNNSFGSYMTKFHKLESLDCSTIDLQSTYHMTALTNLTRLSVFTMTPEMFANIEKLTALKYLQFNVGCEEQSNLQQLNFGKLPNLEHLNICPQYGIDVSSIMLDGINALRNLTKLTIDWPVISDSVFAEISQCTSLVELSVRAGISDDAVLPLANMTSLKHLKLNPKTYEFTGVNLTCLTSLRQLSVMSFVKLVFTAEDLRQKLPNLCSCSI